MIRVQVPHVDDREAQQICNGESSDLEAKEWQRG